MKPYWFLLLPLTAYGADIYTYKDSNNRFYFTDTPMGNSYRLLSVFRPNLTRQTNQHYNMEQYRKNKAAFTPLIDAIARQYHIDPALLLAIVDTESAFNPKAVSKKGAVGLMQLMPKTAESLGIKNWRKPRQNIQAGALYFRQLLQQFQDTRLALAAYNAGPAAVIKAGNQVPDYPETRQYISKVIAKYNTQQR